MTKLFLLSSFLLLFSCINKEGKINTDTLKNSITDNTSIKSKIVSNTVDTTIKPFSDTSYNLELTIFNTREYNQQKNNSILSFYRSKSGFKGNIFRDSFYCMYSLIDFQDFNNDKVKDLLVFYYTGARANPTYHIYLIDTIKHTLTYVKGFEDLPNPNLDSINNIIISTALAGKDYVSFYRINKKNRLINLGHSYEENYGDSSDRYERAIALIVKEKKDD